MTAPARTVRCTCGGDGNDLWRYPVFPTYALPPAAPAPPPRRRRTAGVVCLLAWLLVFPVWRRSS
jgi:hypothetical protein